MTNKEIAQKTKQYLMDRGWTNDWISEQEKACIFIAVDEVTEYGHHRKRFKDLIVKKLGLTNISGEYDEVLTWNDSQTSVEAIYNLLDSIED